MHLTNYLEQQQRRTEVNAFWPPSNQKADQESQNPPICYNINLFYLQWLLTLMR